MHNSRSLVLAHFWLAFGLFLPAVALGTWQMFVRSPLAGWLGDPELYYRSVTAHGTVMAYAFPFLIVMGFGYAVCATTLERPLRALGWAWLGFWMTAAGAVVAVVPVALGRATVLFTFYPPLTASPFYYLGAVMIVLGSWIWVGVMVANLAAWKREHPGAPVPLAMYAMVACALMWAWTAIGAALEILLVILPTALGLTPTLDAGLARLLFSWTLHAIVYFWLFPAYVAYYTLLPRAAGGRLYSDSMARLAFVLLLVFSMPIGAHHLYADPQVGSGFKFLHAVFTGMVTVPTLLTIFTICASLEIAGRLRGGTGLLGWVARLPWDRPMVLASGLSLVLLGFGGAGGLINMSYAMNSTVHNTQWVTGHFHLIFGGAVVMMYFAIAYEFWPQLAGRVLAAPGLARLQMWLWFIGMLVVSLPWHVVGMMGQPRRMAYFDYSDPALAPQAPWVTASAIGGFILLASAVLLLIILWRTHSNRQEAAGPMRYALAVHPPKTVPAALNGFTLWVALMIGLTAVNYGYPLVQLLTSDHVPVLAVPPGGSP